MNQRLRIQGKRNHLFGQSAENQVSAWYVQRGYKPLAQRWKCPEGEIDLIFEMDAVLVFVEVKSSKSHDRAVQALAPKQIGRLIDAAGAFLANTGRSLDCDMRFDLATCTDLGRVEILHNAITA